MRQLCMCVFWQRILLFISRSVLLSWEIKTRISTPQPEELGRNWGTMGIYHPHSLFQIVLSWAQCVRVEWQRAAPLPNAALQDAAVVSMQVPNTAVPCVVPFTRSFRDLCQSPPMHIYIFQGHHSELLHQANLLKNKFSIGLIQTNKERKRHGKEFQILMLHYLGW